MKTGKEKRSKSAKVSSIYKRGSRANWNINFREQSKKAVEVKKIISNKQKEYERDFMQIEEDENEEEVAPLPEESQGMQVVKEIRQKMANKIKSDQRKQKRERLLGLEIDKRNMDDFIKKSQKEEKEEKERAN